MVSLLKLAKVTEEGVRFLSPHDGSPMYVMLCSLSEFEAGGRLRRKEWAGIDAVCRVLGSSPPNIPCPSKTPSAPTS